MICRIFEKFINKRFVVQFVKCGLISDFKYGFRSSLSFADFMTFFFYRITGYCDKSRATRAMTLDISKVHDV